MEKRLFTSESVTEGHPDKMCDGKRPDEPCSLRDSKLYRFRTGNR